MSFLERLIAEKNELGERILKLTAFIDSEKINEVDAQQKILLNLQKTAMANYYEVLQARVTLLTEPITQG